MMQNDNTHSNSSRHNIGICGAIDGKDHPNEVQRKNCKDYDFNCKRRMQLLSNNNVILN